MRSRSTFPGFISCLFFLFFISLTESALSQRANSAELCDEENIFKVEKLREEFHKKFPDNLKKTDEFGSNINWRNTYTHANDAAVYTTARFRKGDIYTCWDSMETYLNSILQRIIPPEIKKSNPDLKVFLDKDWLPNASMSSIGHIMFNLGEFEQANSEAEIAAVLAHEVVHYFKQHSMTAYEKHINAAAYGMFLWDMKKLRKFSIQNELEADSLGIVWLSKAGYSVKGFIDLGEKMNRLEAKILMNHKAFREFPETSHPNSKKRFAIIRKLAEENFNYQGKEFLVSEDLFTRYKQLSKLEILATMLSEIRYHECIETAFKFHILDVENTTYIYYLMEGLRRAMVTDTLLANENFINHLYYIDPNRNKINSSKELLNRSIFQKIPTDILMLSNQDIAKIQARFYWEQAPKFRSNIEAFNYYAKVGEVLNLPESYFSNAMLYRTDSIRRDSLLTKYLTFKNIKHQSLAENILNRKAFELPDKKLLVLNWYGIGIRNGGSENDRFLLKSYSQNETLFLHNFFTETKKQLPNYSGFINVFERDLDNKDKLLLHNLEQLNAFNLRVARQPPLTLFALFPESWSFFQKYNVRELTFLKFYVAENHKLEKDFHEFKSWFSLNYNDFFAGEAKSNFRFSDILISSLRTQAGVLLSQSFYTGEGKLSVKNTSSLSQLQKYFIEEINKSDVLNKDELETKKARIK